MRFVHGLLIATLFVQAVRAEGGPAVHSDSSWVREVLELLQGEDYVGAASRLEAVPVDQRRVQWYGVAMNVLRSRAKAQGVEQDEIDRHLLSLMEQGLVRYPGSSRLLYWKACLLLRGIEFEEGRRLLKEARTLAHRNIETDTTGALSDDEEELLREIALVEESFGGTEAGAGAKDVAR